MPKAKTKARPKAKAKTTAVAKRTGRYDWPHKPFNPYGAREHIALTQANTNEAIDTILMSPYEDVLAMSEENKNPVLIKLFSTCVVGDVERKDLKASKHLIDRRIGKAQQNILITPTTASRKDGIATYEEFCATAGYPAPFDKQVSMYEFGMHVPGVHMLLGSRGYGKTDYVVICGYAYEVYLDYKRALAEDRPPEETCLLITKSKDRNAAIIEEVMKACIANGVPFEKQGSSGIRVEGLRGKDHTLSALTIGSKGLRGRHPKRAMLDDVVTEDDTSESTRSKVQRMYNELIKLVDNILLIGQPVHKFDLYEYLRALEDGVEKMEVPHGCIPELDHDLEAQRLAGVSEESIQASYHLKVISESGMPLELVNYLPDFEPGDCVAWIDPSHEGGDYTAMTVLRGHFEGIAVFGKVWKRAWFNCVDEIAKVCEERGVLKLAFETNALGDQPVDLLREVLEGVGVVGRRSSTNKHARISAAGPFAKQIFIAKTSDPLYIQHVVKYEYKAKFDDAPDSLASCMAWVGLIRGKD